MKIKGSHEDQRAIQQHAPSLSRTLAMDNNISISKEIACTKTPLMQLRLRFGDISKVLAPEPEEDKPQRQEEVEEPPARGAHAL